MSISNLSPVAGQEGYTPKTTKPPRAGGFRSRKTNDDLRGNYSLTPPKKTLRPRQQEAFEAVFNRLGAGVTRQLVSLPTGGDKTLLALHIALQFRRVLFLVHRRELLEQTIQAAKDVGYPDEAIGVIWGDSHETDKRLVVGMIKTIYSRLDRIPRDQFEAAIIDEGHHATASTWRTVAEHFDCKLRLGLSATPERSDGAPLNNLFDEISYSLDIRDAINEGLLVRPIGVQTKTSFSLDKVKTLAGDFNEGQLQKAIDTPERNRLVAEKYLEHAEGRKALVFAAGIGHAANLAGEFVRQGIKADFIHGQDLERQDKLDAFASGEIQALANAMVLTEGFDQPDVSAVLLARPTKSRPLFAQMLGRGLRLAPNKKDCVVLDFADTTHRHSLVTAWNFFGHKGEPEGLADVSQPTERQKALKATIEQLELNIPLEILDQRIDLLAPPPKVDPFSYGQYAWHHQPPTDKQREVLEVNGFDVSGWTRGQASAAIGNLPATQRQLRLLLAHRFDVVTRQWTQRQAHQVLEQVQGQRPDWSLLGRAGV